MFVQVYSYLEIVAISSHGFVCISGNVNWELLLYIISGLSSFVIMLLTICLLRHFMKGRVWKSRRQRSRNAQIEQQQESYVMNPQYTGPNPSECL